MSSLDVVFDILLLYDAAYRKMLLSDKSYHSASSYSYKSHPLHAEINIFVKKIINSKLKMNFVKKSIFIAKKYFSITGLFHTDFSRPDIANFIRFMTDSSPENAPSMGYYLLKPFEVLNLTIFLYIPCK